MNTSVSEVFQSVKKAQDLPGLKFIPTYHRPPAACAVYQRPAYFGKGAFQFLFGDTIL